MPWCYAPISFLCHNSHSSSSSKQRQSMRVCHVGRGAACMPESIGRALNQSTVSGGSMQAAPCGCDHSTHPTTTPLQRRLVPDELPAASDQSIQPSTSCGAAQHLRPWRRQRRRRRARRWRAAARFGKTLEGFRGRECKAASPRAQSRWKLLVTLERARKPGSPRGRRRRQAATAKTIGPSPAGLCVFLAFQTSPAHRDRPRKSLEQQGGRTQHGRSRGGFVHDQRRSRATIALPNF